MADNKRKQIKAEDVDVPVNVTLFLYETADHKDNRTKTDNTIYNITTKKNIDGGGIIKENQTYAKQLPGGQNYEEIDRNLLVIAKDKGKSYAIEKNENIIPPYNSYLVEIKNPGFYERYRGWIYAGLIVLILLVIFFLLAKFTDVFSFMGFGKKEKHVDRDTVIEEVEIKQQK